MPPDIATLNKNGNNTHGNPRKMLVIVFLLTIVVAVVVRETILVLFPPRRRRVYTVLPVRSRTRYIDNQSHDIKPSHPTESQNHGYPTVLRLATAHFHGSAHLA